MKDRAKKASTRMGVAAVAGAGMTFAFPALAFASEEEAGGISAILPDMAEFIPMLVIFILLWIVLAKLGWPQVRGHAGEARDDDQGCPREVRSRPASRASGCSRSTSVQLDDAKAQAAQIVADAKQTGEAAKADITGQGPVRGDRHDRQGAHGHRGGEEGCHRRAPELGCRHVRSRLRRASSARTSATSEHRKMIERYVNEAGSFDAN